MSLTDYPTDTHALTLPTQEQLDRLAGAWLASFASPRTREVYRKNLLSFIAFLEGVGAGITLEKASRVHVDLYARHLESLDYSPNTRAQRLASVSSFYEYACLLGAMSSNPAAKVRRPKLSKYSPRLGLNLDTAPPVIEAAEKLGETHAGIVALCLFAGLRISEALGICRANTLRVESGVRLVEFVGKGGEVQRVPLSPTALRLLAPLLEKYPIGSLLRDSKGKPLDRWQALRMVAAIGKAAGVENLTPHSLRHGCATCALEAGEPIHRVQQLLRHASPVTTQRYDHSRDYLEKSAVWGLDKALLVEAEAEHQDLVRRIGEHLGSEA